MSVLATKLHVPNPRRQLVPRPRLTDRLRACSEVMPRLVLVAAPAGFVCATRPVIIRRRIPSAPKLVLSQHIESSCADDLLADGQGFVG